MLATIWTKTILDRWKATLIGAGTMGLLLLFGMSVYRDIDLAVYTTLPEALRALMNIPADADVGSLAYGAIYASYGALTLAGLAISLGSASIAGEERTGTMGLLLGNPKSRTTVIVSKALSMVVLTSAAAVLLWGFGVLAPVMLDVDITGIHIGALIIHMAFVALFYGFVALALGAWTGRNSIASGASAALLVVSFFAVGLLPLFENLADLTRLFPWHYYQSSQPVTNGVDWPDIAVLGIGIAVLAVASIIGVNRRDLRSQSTGASLVDRLRSNQLTEKVVDRLAGSTRVSHIWTKTASEHQGLLIVTAAIMFFLMGIMIGPMYALLDQTLLSFADQFPEEVLALVGGGDMTTPEGFYQVETFGLMAPIAVMVVTLAIGARALAGEEAARTMGLLLANPIKRSKIVIQKSWAMVIYAFAVGVATGTGVAVGSLVGGLDMSMTNIAATSLLVTLLGLAFGAFALMLSAATGRVRLSIYTTIGLALAAHIVNSFLPLNESLAGYARWSPFYYYLTSDPLLNGMQWGHAAVLVAITGVLVWLAVMLFHRRDLRQTG